MAGGGGSEPNLTPFIDLFSVLICFLLMTASWLHLETMQVQTEKKKEPSASAAPTEPPPPEDKEKKTKLVVFIHPDKVTALEDEIATDIPNQAANMDIDRLKVVLAGWRQKYPAKKDIIVNTDNAVTYGMMIKMYDFLIATDWSDVGINPF
jgi:biopolymer transport protein TolR